MENHLIEEAMDEVDPNVNLEELTQEGRTIRNKYNDNNSFIMFHSNVWLFCPCDPADHKNVVTINFF